MAAKTSTSNTTAAKATNRAARARRQLRDRFGDVDQARDVLRALTALLDEMDDPPLAVSEEDEAERVKRATRRPDGDASGA